jgi:biotin carboxyl carrier protein
MILEAMKMEHRVVASEDGTVTKVSFSAGDRVEQGASLLEVESNHRHD